MRNYRQEDLPYILELYDHTLTGSFHFNRDKNFSKHFMRYPGVHKDSIFVATVDNEITGLAIISIETREWDLRLANIVEFQAKDASSMRALIQVALKYSIGKNVDAIVMVPPPTLASEQALKGWLKFETGVMMVKALSFSSLLQVLFSAREMELKKYFAGKRVVFGVGDEFVEVKATPERVEISEIDGEPEGDAITLTMSPQTFLKVVFGGIHFFIACLTGKVKIRGVKNVIPIFNLFRMLKLANRVYVSNADRL